MQVRKPIIPAAGFGTRMLPATKAQAVSLKKQTLSSLFSTG
jgi:UTP-glucose-1-phosphate uridylyltransferase